MRFRVLGPVSLSPRTPSAAKPRALLATLLVQAGEVVPVHSLIDELWGTEPPRTATTTLQVYVSQLRKVLADGGSPAPAGELLTRAPGYLLAVPELEFDLPCFEQLRAQGRTAYQEGDFDDASRLLREALALWTGPALSGIPHGVRLESAAIRLDELRMEVLEQRIVADLRLGRHQELAGELLALANEYPLRESLHGHLMVALYRTGRGSDALRVYGRLRHSLVEELGVEPGPGLSRLHERVLRRDPSLDWQPPRGARDAGRADTGRGTGAPAYPGAPRRGTGPAGGPRPLPGPPPALPSAPPGFVGRHEELVHGERALRGSVGKPPARVLALSGPAGVGKTALALQLAHRTADLFPDGGLLIGLRGPQGRPLSASQAGAALLRRLTDDVSDAPLTDPEELTDRLRRALGGRRILLILDDAASEQQIRPLLRAFAEGTVILTGRRRAAALDGAEHLGLDAVRPEEAVELLLAAGGERMAQDPVAAAEIARLCACFPLALRVAAAALTARPHTTPAALAGRLRDERTRLGVLREGDLDLRSSLLTGYQEAGPALRRAFRLLSLAPTADFTGWTVAALLGTGPAEAEETAEELVRAQLLEARTDGQSVRYGFHSLLRVLATELREAEPDAARTRRDAVERLGRACVALARHADGRLTPGRDWRSRPLDAAPGSDAAAIVGASPLGWFREEATGLVETVRQAHAAGLWSLVWQLAGSAAGYFHARAAWEEWEETHRLALDAARRAGSVEAEAVVQYSLGDLAWQRRQADRALRHHTAAQHAFELVRDRTGVARCRIGAADVLLGQGLPEPAARRYGRALAMCSAEGDLRGEVAALNGLALVNLRRGRPEVAMRHLEQCRRAAERLGDRRWTEYVRRTAARLAPDSSRRPSPLAHAVEVRPGMWLIGTAGSALTPAGAA
ncbi:MULTISPECIES: BTAD domain-containing putative transcriptional regulator [Streptomyces]|uniref:Transcriptional activator n=2 Tax=Streptomyces TaxID=1883 RepID=M3F2Y4_9ACTN|nr:MULTISPECIES: BTAD domain-containing putative transcriptional regulator [Streptomyces]EMF55898.1 transcriptional activator [Streptomyces bottropensis ATCC 25435]MZD16445.1 transcriptional regulator [Streptomyces sp. SID5476]